MTKFRGRPPGSGAGDMSRRTAALRPTIGLSPKLAAMARQMRREGHAPEQISLALKAPLDDVEKALCQLRMPRPETTRGTVNVTLAAHAAIMKERRDSEPLWVVMDRLLEELFSLRGGHVKASGGAGGPRQSAKTPPLIALMEGNSPSN